MNRIENLRKGLIEIATRGCELDGEDYCHNTPSIKDNLEEYCPPCFAAHFLTKDDETKKEEDKLPREEAMRLARQAEKHWESMVADAFEKKLLVVTCSGCGKEYPCPSDCPCGSGFGWNI